MAVFSAYSAGCNRGMSDGRLDVEALTKSFGGLVAADAVSLVLEPGELHAVIGPNGAGKTTLINLLAGQLKADTGTVRFDGTAITHWSAAARAKKGLVRSFQITSIFSDFTVLDNVALATQARLGHSFHFWRRARSEQVLREPAMETLERVGLADRADIMAGNLSHGEQRALEIAIALATNPRVLLLDEPMAGMGAEDSGRMIEFLRTLKGTYTIMLVEHDMDAVFALADRITVLVYGRPIATGRPDEIRANPDVRQAYLGDEEPAAA